MAKKLSDLKQKTFNQLSEYFGQFTPKHCLRPSESGALSRQRLFSKGNTFGAFLPQELDANGGCIATNKKPGVVVIRNDYIFIQIPTLTNSGGQALQSIREIKTDATLKK